MGDINKIEYKYRMQISHFSPFTLRLNTFSHRRPVSVPIIPGLKWEILNSSKILSMVSTCSLPTRVLSTLKSSSR